MRRYIHIRAELIVMLLCTSYTFPIKLVIIRDSIAFVVYFYQHVCIHHNHLLFIYSEKSACEFSIAAGELI